MKAINKKKFNMFLTLMVVILALAVVTPAFAQEPEPPTADQVNDIALSLNIFWMLLGGFLVFMQAGFALVETGFTRAKNVAHTMMMNMMVFCIGAVGYWLTGFAFQFGGVNAAYPEIARAGVIAGVNGHTLPSHLVIGRACSLHLCNPYWSVRYSRRKRVHARWCGNECWYSFLLPLPDGLHGYRPQPSRLVPWLNA